ncbi:MAG: chemotaxis-specific protein-glutamate methyltransferase CheB [Pseudomonadota bacterium]
MSAIRVMIVDDSVAARDVLRAILTQTEDICVVGEAANGQEAVAMAARLLPQLITMDLTMPVMDGFSAIEEIMYARGVPILAISDRSDVQTAYQALEVGALDIMPKPVLGSIEAQRLVERVKLLAGVSVITRLRRRLVQPPPSAPVLTPAPTPSPCSTRCFPRIVAITCSTGGPQALLRLLSPLPATFPAPIVVAQHISHGFIDGMATWLGSLCRLSVCVGEEGQHLRPGTVYLSPSDSNLGVTQRHRLTLLPSLPNAIYHPSGDVLLSSVADTYGGDAIGIILTGMGRDGVSGMRAIHLAGGLTLAQDEASSVIYGMNHEAVKAGIIQNELPLNELTQRLQQEAGRSRSERLS